MQKPTISRNRFDPYMLIALLAPIAYCLYYVVQGQLLLKGNSDTIDVNIPYFIAVNDAVSTDLIPSWTRYTFTGFSLIGSPTLLWYPPNWLAFIVDKTYVPHVMTALAWLHFIGVAFAGYIFFREISKSGFWASVSALAYTFSLPIMYGLSSTPQFLAVYVFTPLALYIIHTHRNRARRLNSVYLALITFALITGALIQITLYSLGIIFLYSLIIGIFGTETSTGDKKIIPYFWGGIVLGFFMSAPMLLPLFAISSDTSRDFAALDIYTIYKYMVKGSPGLLWRLFSPNAFGLNMLFPGPLQGGVNYVESMNAFCGVIMLFLAGYAITARRSVVVLFFFTLSTGIILITVTPLAYIHIFLFGLKPVLNRASFLLPLAIASLAAVGGRQLDIMNNLPSKKIVLNPIWLLLLVAAMYVMPNKGYFYFEITRGIVFVGIFIITYNIFKYRKHLWHIIVLCLVIIEVVWSGHLMTTVQVYPLMVKPKDYYTYGNPNNLFPLSKTDLEQFRIILSGIKDQKSKAPFGAMEANQGIIYGYMSPWGYNNAYSLRLAIFLTKLTGQGLPGGLGREVYFKADPPYDKIADLTSVGYIVDYKDKKWHVIEDRRQRSLPRASLFYEYESANVEHINIEHINIEQKGLVGYWKFDNNAEDSSGYNNHGRWIGKEQYNNGILGKAANFDGTNNYVTIPHSPSIDVGKGAFSFGAWINSAGKENGKNQHFLNKRTGGHGTFWDMYLSSEASNINAEIAGKSYDNPPSGVKRSTWHHIFLTRDRLGLTTVYVDGNFIKSKYMTGDSSNTHSLNIGKLEGSLEQGFKGLIDEVVIYNRALTMKEVIKIYSSYLNLYGEKKTSIQKLITDNIFKDPNFPTKQKVVLTSEFNLPIGPPDPNSYVKFIKNGNSHIILEYETRTPAILLLTDVLTNGWTAYVDGKQTDIMEGNIAFRAVYVPPGKHKVEFKYFPPGLLLSLLPSLIGISVCVVLYRKR